MNSRLESKNSISSTSGTSWGNALFFHDSQHLKIFSGSLNTRHLIIQLPEQLALLDLSLRNHYPLLETSSDFVTDYIKDVFVYQEKSLLLVHQKPASSTFHVTRGHLVKSKTGLQCELSMGSTVTLDGQYAAGILSPDRRFLLIYKNDWKMSHLFSTDPFSEIDCSRIPNLFRYARKTILSSSHIGFLDFCFLTVFKFDSLQSKKNIARLANIFMIEDRISRLHSISPNGKWIASLIEEFEESTSKIKLVLRIYTFNKIRPKTINVSSIHTAIYWLDDSSLVYLAEKSNGACVMRFYPDTNHSKEIYYSPRPVTEFCIVQNTLLICYDKPTEIIYCVLESKIQDQLLPHIQRGLPSTLAPHFPLIADYVEDKETAKNKTAELFLEYLWSHPTKHIKKVDRKNCRDMLYHVSRYITTSIPGVKSISFINRFFQQPSDFEKENTAREKAQKFQDALREAAANKLDSENYETCINRVLVEYSITKDKCSYNDRAFIEGCLILDQENIERRFIL